LTEKGRLLRGALNAAPPAVRPGMQKALRRYRQLTAFARSDFEIAAEASRRKRTEAEGGS
jgi:hypothetical protein